MTTVEQLLHTYSIAECDEDGYPLAWHRCPDCHRSDSGCATCGDRGSIKGVIRDLASHRCVRCGHPYIVGECHAGGGEWSPCDEHCRHAGVVRLPDLAKHPGRVTTVTSATGPAVHPGYRIEARWRILAVHHLNEDKADCRWWNLAALCQRCRLRIQGRLNMAPTYPFEHSDWFKPYAAGCLASSYLGEDLTREEAEARLNELLDLERRN